MPETALYTLIISSEIPIDEINSLETSLRLSSVTVQKDLERAVGVDDVVLVCTVLAGVAAAGQIVDYGIKVAKVIIEWRRRLKEKGIKPKGTLEKPGKAPLDLSNVTDEEIEEWLSQKKKQ